MNRIIVIFALWATLLAFCVFVSTNVYLNTFALTCGFFCAIFSISYVSHNMNDKELRFFNKLFVFIN